MQSDLSYDETIQALVGTLEAIILNSTSDRQKWKRMAVLVARTILVAFNVSAEADADHESLACRDARRRRGVMSKQEISMSNKLSEPFFRTCPDCGGKAPVVGGFNDVEYIACSACGFYGDHYVDDGVVYTCRVPVVDGCRRFAEATDHKQRPAVEGDDGEVGR
jgi:hypothetical protein